MDRRLAFGALFCVTLGLVACTTGGGNVTYPNPLNPTPGPKPTATAAPTATAVPSTSPTPTSTSSPGNACPPTYPSAPATETTPLPVNGGIITIPVFGDFNGTATTPALAQGAGATVSLKDSNQNFDAQPIPAGQSGVFFVSLTLSQLVAFSNQNIQTTIAANCTIVPGATYTANVYALGGIVQNPQTAVATSTHTLTFTIIVPANGNGGGTFPGGVPADVVISK